MRRELRKIKQLANRAFWQTTVAVREFKQRHERPVGPLDWSCSLYTSTWTREAHAKHPYPVNSVVAALFLGLHVLVDLFDVVPLVDPEVLEEALQVGVCLNDSSSYVSKDGFTGFVRQVGDKTVPSGIVRARVGYNSVFTGVVCGTDAVGTYATETFDNSIGAIGPVRTFTGRMTVYESAVLGMYYSGDGELVHHVDGTVYRGGFHDGLYSGSGTFSSGDGTVLYKGDWDRVPHGSGMVRVTWADTPLGASVYLVGKFDRGTPVGVYVMTDECGFTLCEATVASVVAAGCHWNHWGMSYHDTAEGSAVATFGQSVLSYYISRSDATGWSGPTASGKKPGQRQTGV